MPLARSSIALEESGERGEKYTLSPVTIFHNSFKILTTRRRRLAPHSRRNGGVYAKEKRLARRVARGHSRPLAGCARARRPGQPATTGAAGGGLPVRLLDRHMERRPDRGR